MKRSSGQIDMRPPQQPNFSLHWTGSSRFSLLQCRPRWRLLPASELRRWNYSCQHRFTE